MKSSIGLHVQLVLKRLTDILISLIGLILLAVPFVLIALAIKLDSRGPVFFRQEREAMGRRGRKYVEEYHDISIAGGEVDSVH